MWQLWLSLWSTHNTKKILKVWSLCMQNWQARGALEKVRKSPQTTSMVKQKGHEYVWFARYKNDHIENSINCLNSKRPSSGFLVHLTNELSSFRNWNKKKKKLIGILANSPRSDPLNQFLATLTANVKNKGRDNKGISCQSVANHTDYVYTKSHRNMLIRSMKIARFCFRMIFGLHLENNWVWSMWHRAVKVIFLSSTQNSLWLVKISAL